MSTRWYPLYQKGNPQIRVFLPNLFMKLVKPEQHQPKNLVTFHVSLQMTKHDVKNYLEKIYNVPVVKVSTRIKLGEIKKHPQMQTIVKQDDIKIAYVYLNKDQEFEYPTLTKPPTKSKEAEIRENTLKDMKEETARFEDKHKQSQGIPGWYSI